MATIELILERNPRLTREEVLRRVELTPAMRERIAKHRADPSYSIFAQPGETDEQIAIDFVACDAASERDKLPEAER